MIQSIHTWTNYFNRYSAGSIEMAWEFEVFEDKIGTYWKKEPERVMSFAHMNEMDADAFFPRQS